MTKLGICISPFMGLSLGRLAEFAQESENAGIEGIFIPEGKNDGLICCYAAAKATNRVMVATWIVNIFLREAALCSWAARQIAQEIPSRFILGLGVSHRPLLESLGIRVPDPRERLRRYTRELRNYLAVQDTSQPTVGGVPIYFAALALETVRLGAEIADGLMLDICTVNRLQTAAATACDILNRNGRSRAQLYDHYRHSAFPASGSRPGAGCSTTHTRALCFPTSVQSHVRTQRIRYRNGATVGYARFH